MSAPRTRRLCAACLLLLTCFPVVRAQTDAQRQQPSLALLSAEVALGKQALEQGDAAGAVKILRAAADSNERDGAAWHYLGLAYAASGEKKKASEALERAVSVRTGAFQGELNGQLRDDRGLSLQEGGARRRIFGLKAKALIESVEKFVEAGAPDPEMWREWLAGLRLYARLADDPRFEAEPFRLARHATKLSILRKPEPGYTDEARGKVRGNVRLRALLGADGTVKGVIVMKKLGGGLTEQAVKAARRIEFKPATVGGQPVAHFVILEYNFDYY